MSIKIIAGSNITVALAPDEALEVFGTGNYQVASPAFAGNSNVMRTIPASGQRVGPFTQWATVQLFATSALTYDVLSPDDVLDRKGRRARRTVPRLLRAPQTLKKCWMGKVQSTANGADHTSSYYTTLECHTDRIRVWVINPVAAILVNVRVSVGTSDTMPAELTSLHGSSTAGGTNLSNGNLATSATFSVAAGVDANNVSATASPWLDISTIDRVDVIGALPIVRVRVEIPTAGNANRPACDTSATRAGWEAEGSASVAPFGRPMRARIGTGLGVTTPSAASSTAYSDIAIPIIIEYMPRTGRGITAMFGPGDSIMEGSGATIAGHGWPYIARAQLSTMENPVEVCMIAAAATTPTQQRERGESLIPLIKPELCILSLFSPNGSTPPTFSATSSARTQYREAQRLRMVCADNDVAVIGFSGIPMLAVAPDSTSASEDYDAASVIELNKFMASILNSNEPLINAYTPMSGPLDAEGQATMLLGTSADGIHPNTTGHNIMALPAVAELRAFVEQL